MKETKIAKEDWIYDWTSFWIGLISGLVLMFAFLLAAKFII